MKKRLAILALSMISLFSAAAAVVSTIAWFSTENKMDYVEGGAVASYFKSGSGTQNDPYIIASRNHVYNLAWLQYIGYFNGGGNNTVQFDFAQPYFKVENDIDMEGLTIPPIGTEKYPFLGHFDGNGCTISNFTISNDNPVPDNSEFGVAKPANLYAGEVSDVVGFFGVVGKLPSQSITYDSSIVSLTNVTLSDFTVRSKTTSTLIGLAAGYVDGAMSGVKVDGDATIDVSGISHTAKTAYTTKLSDYGLVGYTTKTSSSGTYSQSISEWFDSTDTEYGGGTLEPSWGGTIDMKSFFARLSSFKSSATAVDLKKRIQTIDSSGTPGQETTAIVSSDAFYNFQDNANKKGSVCISKENNGTNQNILSLTGSQYMKKETTDYQNSSNYIFFADAFGKFIYPRTSGNVATVSSDAPNPPPSSYGWQYSQKNLTLPTGTNNPVTIGKIYAVIDDVTYWLHYEYISSNVRPRVTTNEADAATWQVEYLDSYNNKNYYCVYSSFKVGSTTSNYYWRKAAPANTTKPSSNSPTNSGSMFITINSTPEIRTTVSNVLQDCYDTYLPLNVNESNGATLKNTGYIVSSSDYEGISFPSNSGTIRIAQHTYNPNDTDHQYYANTSTIYTIYNGTEQNAANVTNYANYADTKTEFDSIISSDSTHFYGLHFMSSTIDKDEYATIPSGYVNKQTITNYKVPKNSIDFNLSERGIITFYAGTYYSDADAFFSLHKVTRDASKNITSIDEIKKIYKNNSDENASYLLETSSHTPSSTTGYTLIFNTDWITNPSLTAHRIYYFEIPVDAGEYCLGSVSGHDGAYLMYLDIGTSNKDIGQDVITGYAIITEKSTRAYPVGVDFAVVGVGISGGDSICVSIASSKVGTIKFEISSTVIVITSANEFSTYSYQGTKYRESASTGYFTVSGNSPGALPSASTTRIRDIYATILTTTDAIYTIVVTDVLSSPASTTYMLDGVQKADLAALQAIVPTFTSDVLTAMRELGTIVTLTRSGAGSDFITTPTFSEANRKNVVINLNITGVSVAVSNVSTYTIYKQSIANANMMTNGNTYSF